MRALQNARIVTNPDLLPLIQIKGWPAPLGHVRTGLDTRYILFTNEPPVEAVLIPSTAEGLRC